MTEQAHSTRRTQIFVLAAVVGWMASVAACVQLFGVVLGLVAGVWGVPILVICGAGVLHQRTSAAVRPAVVDESIELNLSADQRSLQPVG